MSKSPDYYATLRVPRDATQQQISRAYRALMRSHHPDMEGGRDTSGGQGGGAAGAAPQEGELLRIMEAFAVLRDPARRAAYDRQVKAASAARAAPASQSRRDIPVRKVQRAPAPSGDTIRITPVRWESGPWV